MALVSVGGEPLQYPDVQTLAVIQSGGTNFTFDGATDVLASVFHIPQTGTISKVHFNVATSSSAVLNLRTELRTVDATTGLPSAAGTLYGSSTSISASNPTTGFKTAAVNCTGATAGDLVALVMDLSAYTSGSIALTRRISSTPFASQLAFPYDVANTSGSTAVGAFQWNSWALEYGSHLYYPLEVNLLCATSSQSSVSNSGLTRRGNRFVLPFPVRAVGMYCGGDLDGDCLLRIRLASDDSIVATATIDKDVRGLTTAGMFQVFFDATATVNLSANTVYYALIEGNSATASNILFLTTVENQQLDQISGGQTCYGRNYTSPNYSDQTTVRYVIGILFDQLDNGLWPAIGAAG